MMSENNKIGTYKFVAEPFHVDFTGRLTMGVLGNHLLKLCGFPCQRPRFWHRDSKRGQLYLGIVPSGCRTG